MKTRWVLCAVLLFGATPLVAQNQILGLEQGAYVQLPGHIFGHLEEATVEAWVRWEDWGSYSQFFAFGADEQWKAMGVNHAADSPLLQFFLYTDKDRVHVLPVATDLPLGQWCHMAAVSGREGMKFYLNGVLVGENTYAGSFAAIGEDEDNYLGKSSWKANAFFHGQLDEVRVWAVARSGEQIREGMSQVLSGSEEGLAGLWNFDAGDARDLSPHGHHGQMLGGARCVVAPFPGARAVFRPALVEGRVGDAIGPMGGVVVLLKEGVAERVRMSTGQDGRYKLALFGEGTCVLSARLGKASQQQEVVLVEGETRQLDLELPPGTEPLPADTVAFWPGEGDARDVVGHYHGKLVQGATFAPGLVGQAFSFDGQGSYVELPPQVGNLGTSDFTIDLWMRRTQRRGGVDPLLVKRTADSVRFFSLHLDYAGRMQLEMRNGDQMNYIFSYRNLRAQVWHHRAVVREGKEVRLYIDGQLDNQQTSVGEVVELASQEPLALGASLPYELYYQGLIDEICIRNRALSDAEIQQIYSAKTVALWSAEGNAEDIRGGNDGFLVNSMDFAPGVVGQAFLFDGSGGYVEFDPYIGNFGTADFSVELWLRREESQDTPAPVLLKRSSEEYMWDLHLDEAGRVRVQLRSPDNVNLFGSTRSLSALSWHHLALVRQGKVVELYIDGLLDTLNATERVVEVAAPTSMTLGAVPTRNLYFRGKIDEVSIHNRALRPDEIQNIYLEGLQTWRQETWMGVLKRGGVGLLVLAAFFSSARYYTQRRESRRLRELLLVEERRARTAAEAANQAKSIFLANMSHEIRTPMNAILGYAQILRDHSALSAEQRRAVETIHASGDHLLGLINDVLDLSKIEAGQMELQEVDFDLGQLVKGLVAMFQLRCQQQGLGWRVEQEGTGRLVRGDEHKLRQVLINLLGNAVKFTDAGEVVLRVGVSGALYYFEVRDTGPGIPLQQQEEIFEPFQQGGAGVHKGGTGLGLSIARRHVELMGGHLQLESAPGQGSRFFFSLRLEPARGPVPEKAATHGQVLRLRAGFAPRLLIADDMATNREILAQVLERIGARVRQADCGERALEALREERPDLVFLDIRMTDMGGLEALHQIRREHGALPVVAISASVMEHEWQHYLQSGFDAFLDKPFRLENIYSCLEKLLGAQYEYAEPPASQPPADFSGLRLPAPLRARLRQAVEMRNVTAVKKCLDQVQELGAGERRLAAHLGELAQRLDVDSMLRILESTADG